MIDITGVDLKEFVKKVYELSKPQGLGFLHYESGGLSDEEAQFIVDNCYNPTRFAVAMDYVKGRACKMTVHKNGDKLEIKDSWYDHSENQLKELLSHFGLEVA